VLEQAQDPHSALKQLPFGLRGLSLPTTEAFHRWGLLDEILAAQRAKSGAIKSAAHWMQQTRKPAGHFAGIQFFEDDVDASTWSWRLPTPADASIAVDMDTLETVLAARASSLGFEIRRGFGVTAVAASDDDVSVQAAGESFRGRWLVGCDGGRSTVRKACGFDFVGTDPEFTGYSIDVELTDPEKLSPGRNYTAAGMYTFALPGTIAMVDFDGGAFHRSAPITREHVQDILRRVSGTDVTITSVRLAATWTDGARQATTYRRGRVLLAGDAAHTHSPLGGQGLNLGLGDAMNLGWKLAAMVRGHAPDDLLDTYSRERHPVGAQILDWSRAQVAIMRPTPSSRALQAIMRDLIATRDGATYFAAHVRGVSLRYDLADGHPLVGRSVPEFELADGTHVGELLRSATGLLLDFDTRASLQTLASRWGDRITYVASAPRERLGLSAVLVRPDGFVAWASDGALDIDELARAAARWFGEPATGTA
jgi:2-polyprenyl-6-methoxyphenol hydroxylase-like FAD-dependent oxidoreductase